MVKDLILPKPFRVAGLALLSKLSLVLIIASMTGITGGRCFRCGHRFSVAALTFGGSMFPLERIFGVLIMIECDYLPAFCGMTILAFLPEHSFMVIILLMATVTISWSALKPLFFVAIVAGHIVMFP